MKLLTTSVNNSSSSSSGVAQEPFINQGMREKKTTRRQQNMVWKIRNKSKRNKSSSPAVKTNDKNLKSCLKKTDYADDSIGSSESGISATLHKKSCIQSETSITGDGTTKSGSNFSTGSKKERNSTGSVPSEKGEHSSTSSASTSSSLLASSHNNTHSTGRSRESSRPTVERSVRFNEIRIREYERIVSDNPSCSCGPPIGIGWSYENDIVMNVETFEEGRLNRQRLVLTRQEREALLLNWGASVNDIIEAIRGNVRVKNQRRQTVTNLGKVERLEEAFESATRALKRALMLRPCTASEVKELLKEHQRANAVSALQSLKFAEERALGEIVADQAPEHVEPEGKDHLDSLGGVEVKVSDFCRNSPAESMVRKSPQVIAAEEDACASLEGLTIGNSTSASMRELENFYRELELEMFGDDLPPDMVGKTLELPTIESAPVDIITTSNDEMEDSVCSSLQASIYTGNVEPRKMNDINGRTMWPTQPWGNPSHAIPIEHGNIQVIHQSMANGSLPSNGLNFPSHLPRHLNYPEYPVMLTASPSSDRFTYDRNSNQNHQYPIQMNNPYIKQGGEIDDRRHINSDNSPSQGSLRRSNSLDSIDFGRKFIAHDLRQEQQISTASPSGGQHYHDGGMTRPGGYSSVEYQHTDRNFSRNLDPFQIPQTASVLGCGPSNSSFSQEPQICHIPQPTYFTPTHWMEGRDTNMALRQHQPVTITEDGSDRGDQIRLGEVTFDCTQYRPPSRQVPPSFY